MTRLKRGDVVQNPGKWERRGGYRHGRAIVMSARARDVVICAFDLPGGKFSPGSPKAALANPHVSHVKPDGLKVIGKVKKIPSACTKVLKWKKGFWEQHPSMAVPTKLGRARKRRKAKR